MTPTLFGRWQSRTFLMLTFGLGVTALYGMTQGELMPFVVVLLYALLIGLLLDPVYQTLQKRRWDQDWSPILFFFTGILEGAILWVLLNLGLPFVEATPPFQLFLTHYSLVWVTVFAMLFSFMRVFSPFWRFRGGRLV